MKTILATIGLFTVLGLIGTACGGNVVVTGGSGAASGAGGNAGGSNVGGTSTGPAVDACTDYANKLIAKYTECGINVSTGTGSGTVTCTPQLAVQATCLAACLPKIDCGCIKDPSGPGCQDKLKPYIDCVTPCVQ